MRKEFLISKDKIPSHPELVLVYRKGEYTNNGIPTAVIALNLEVDDSKKNYLKDSDYKIVVLDSSYDVRFQNK